MQLSLKKKLALEAYRLYRHNEIKAHPLTYFFWDVLFLGMHTPLQLALFALR